VRRETNSSQPVHRATFGQAHCGVGRASGRSARRRLL